MKRLLLLLSLLCLMPAAQAHDSEKCDALSEKSLDLVLKMGQVLGKYHQTKFCGGPQETILKKCDDGSRSKFCKCNDGREVPVIGPFQYGKKTNEITAPYHDQWVNVVKEMEAVGCH